MPKYLKVASSGIVTAFLECPEEARGHLTLDPGERVVQFDYGPVDHSRRWRFDGAALRDAGLFVEPCYSDMRRADYPPVGEQLDCLWHAMDDGILPKVEPFFSKILAVKQTHPKTSN